jgi:hypothetical protein
MGRNFMRCDLDEERGHVARSVRHSAEPLFELTVPSYAGNMPADTGRMPALPT